MESKMMPLTNPAVNGTPGDLPMEDILCVFKPEDSILTKEFILGALCFRVGKSGKKGGSFFIKQYGTGELFLVEEFTHYQPVLNEKGGFYFIK